MSSVTLNRRLLTQTWTPKRLPGLLAWWRAERAWLYQTSAMNDIVTADADVVGGWADLSGNRNHLTQATAGKRPAYKLTQIRGRPTVLFTRAAANEMSTASIAHGIGTGDFCFAAVVNFATITAATAPGVGANGVDNPGFRAASTGTVPNIQLAGNNDFNTSLTAGVWYSILWTRFSGTLFCYVNNTLEASSFANTTSVADAAFYLGDDNNDNYFDGHIVEAWWHKGFPVASQRRAWATYVVNRYGIAQGG